MIRVVFAFVLALAAAAPASAVRTIENIEGAHEVALADFALPTSGVGRLSLRACPTCAQQSFPVNGNTTYTLGAGKPMSLTDFRIAVDQLRQRSGDRVRGVVFYNVSTKRVTRVVVYPPS
jgi:hypothetical protein